MYEGRNAIKRYEQEAARQGNYQLAGEYQALGKAMDSQIQKYDTDGDGKLDTGKDQLMMNDIANYNKQVQQIQAFGHIAGSEEFDNPAAQEFADAGLAHKSKLRETLGKASEKCVNKL
ncbi:MAG: hypothetical protein LRY51_13450 [Geovibrio sp.]|nr:hypothetical protein [Geovibrio sp.]